MVTSFTIVRLVAIYEHAGPRSLVVSVVNAISTKRQGILTENPSKPVGSIRIVESAVALFPVKPMRTAQKNRGLIFGFAGHLESPKLTTNSC